MGHVTQARAFLQFSCHARSNWKITGFQGLPHAIAARHALLRSAALEGAPRLGALPSLRAGLRSASACPSPLQDSPGGRCVGHPRDARGRPARPRPAITARAQKVGRPLLGFPERLQCAATGNYGRTFTVRSAGLTGGACCGADQVELRCKNFFSSVLRTSAASMALPYGEFSTPEGVDNSTLGSDLKTRICPRRNRQRGQRWHRGCGTNV